MKVEDYEVLVALHKAGTVKGAAERLMISQPAISQRLKQIEQTWGVELFIRTPRQLMITPAGEKVVAHGEELLLKEAQLRNELAALHDEVGGSLSLGVSSVVGLYVLPNLLEKYIKQYPKVQLQLTTGLSQDIRRNIKSFHITIFRGEKIKTQPCHHFLSDQLYLIKKHGDDPIIDANRPLIIFEGDETLQSLVAKWIMGNEEVKFSQIIKVDQIETCKQLMKKGIGIAVLPHSAIADLTVEGYDKDPLFVDGKPLTRETWISYSRDSENLPQVMAFLSIQKRMQEEKNL